MNALLGHFFETLVAIVPLALVVGAGALLMRRGWLTDAAVEGLSRAVVHVFLPALIFSKIVAGLDPRAMPYWWLIPITALALFGLGLVLTLLAFPREARRSRDVLPLGFMQNAGYFVIALGERLVPEDFDRFSAYVFLFILGYSPLLWSFGKACMTPSLPGPRAWRAFLTPPLFANLMAVFFVLAGIADYIPGPVMRGVEMAGVAAVPAGLIVLGASLGTVRFGRRTEWGIVLRCVALKVVLVPAVAILLLELSGLRTHWPLLLFMLVLQAVSPHAANLIVHVRTYGGNLERAGSVILVAHLAGLVTIPLWLAVWELLG